MKKLLSSSKIRYLFIGGTVFILELLVILGAQSLGADPVTAVAIGFWTGLIVSFVLQKVITFNDKRTHRTILASQVLAVGILISWNFFFTIMLTKLLSVLPAVLVRTLALLTTTLWNYYIYDRFIFKDRPV